MFFLIGLVAAISLPKWPKTYTLKGTWSIPYWQIREPFTVTTDIPNNRQSESAYNNLAHTALFVDYRSYSVQTKTEEQFCTYSKLEAGKKQLIEYLPTGNDWNYEGVRIVLGRKCHKWTRKIQDKGTYHFYADETTLLPVRYHQFGISIRNSHPAEYIFDIEDFGPIIDESVFEMPIDCKDITTIGPTTDFNGFLGDEQDYCPIYDPPQVKLPKEFTWRDVKGVVGPVRDQANCGSCWAQSAATLIESQLSLHAKGNVTVSAQQLVDCTWGDKTNFGCSGGEGWATFKELMEQKIDLAHEFEYPYIGVAGKCQKTIEKPIGKVTGCKQIKPHDKDALKRSLFLNGPHMVSIIGSVPNFYPYEGGVYDDDRCKITADTQVDHGVLLTGWKIIDGKEVFEIMNSWSTYWGDNGFGYISTGENDCGITEMAMMVEVKLN